MAEYEWRVVHIDMRVGGSEIKVPYSTEDKARQEVALLRGLGEGIRDVHLERRRVAEWEAVPDV